MSPIQTSTGVGARHTRLEDDALIRGTAKYTGDIHFDGLTYAAFVRSTEAHARIRHIDIGGAQEQPGVIAILTAADLGVHTVSLPISSFPSFADLSISPAFHRPPVARNIVRFVGEVVAIVIAESEAAAVDASERVVVDYEPMRVVVDPGLAASDGAPLLFPGAATNVAVDVPFEAGEPPASDVAVEVTITHHRMAAAPLEGAAIVAVPDPISLKLTAYVSTQMAHVLRDAAAGVLGMDRADLQLITPTVGGSFGGKAPVDSDYIAILAAARRVGRPIRWVQSRMENLTTMHARGHRFDVTLRATRDGKVTSIEVDALSDAGAYPGLGCGMVMTARSLCTGAYDIRHARFDARCVATNTAPMGAFRGAGRPEGIAMLERAMDILAVQLRLDPADLRRRNLIGSQCFPYRTVLGGEYDSGEYERSLDVALRTAGYDSLRAEQSDRRARGDNRALGIGLACYVELSASTPGFNHENASVEITDAGRVRILAGTSAHGQGHHTVYAQIVSTVLGLPLDKVDLIDGDTRQVSQGRGTGGSRSLQVGGSAVHRAAEEVLEKARLLAAHLLKVRAPDLFVTRDGLAVRGEPFASIKWAKLAEAAADSELRPQGMTAGLIAAPGFTQDQGGTAPFGCHVAVVEVDSETGAVELRRMVAVDDCGTVVNPMLAEGQIHGGLLGGIGQALFEEVQYDDCGNPLTTSFADYGFPSAAEFPSFETSQTCTPTTRNPLGAKGIGEAGTTGSLGAVHNAVVDAVSHFGIRHIETPLTPFNVWTALRKAQVFTQTVD